MAPGFFFSEGLRSASRSTKAHACVLESEENVSMITQAADHCKDQTISRGRAPVDFKGRVNSDITISRNQRPRWFGGGHDLPDAVDYLRRLLEASSDTLLEAVIAELMDETFKYQSGLSESMQRLTGVLDPKYIRYISRLELCIDVGMVEGHEKIWPGFLKVICGLHQGICTIVTTDSLHCDSNERQLSTDLTSWALLELHVS